jgi:methylglutaconyl-CoA hydratase
MTASQASGSVLWEVDGRGVASVILNRPELNNAYDGDLIQGLLAAMDALARSEGLRVITLKGNGRHFQAGADLKWIDAVRTASSQENIRVSRATATAVRRLEAAPVPTVALVQGGCFGGGTGLIAACDVVIAADNAMFSISEARRIGLVHEVVPLAELESAGARVVGHLLENGPDAISQTKAIAIRSAWSNLDEAAFEKLIESHAAKRQSAEAAEGLASFALKRPARWAKPRI